MKIDNRTDWSTSDLRAVVLAACRHDDYVPPIGAKVRVVYSRRRHYSGWATFGAINLSEPRPRKSAREGRYLDRLMESQCAMLLRIPHPKHGPILIGELAHLVRHEVGHWRGLRHEHMAGALLRWKRGTTIVPEWAGSLRVSVEDDEPSPTRADRAVRNEQNAHEKLVEHEAKLAREKKLVAKWRKRVAYYDRKRDRASVASDVAEVEETRAAASPRSKKAVDVGVSSEEAHDAQTKTSFYVEIYESVPGDGKDRLEKKIGPYATRRLAEKADAGLNRNLDHARFYTTVTPPEREEEEASP